MPPEVVSALSLQTLKGRMDSTWQGRNAMTSELKVKIEQLRLAKTRLKASNSPKGVVDHFYIALFSALEQTHCAGM